MLQELGEYAAARRHSRRDDRTGSPLLDNVASVRRKQVCNGPTVNHRPVCTIPAIAVRVSVGMKSDRRKHDAIHHPEPDAMDMSAVQHLSTLSRQSNARPLHSTRPCRRHRRRGSGRSRARACRRRASGRSSTRGAPPSSTIPRRRDTDRRARVRYPVPSSRTDRLYGSGSGSSPHFSPIRGCGRGSADDDNASGRAWMRRTIGGHATSRGTGGRHRPGRLPRKARFRQMRLDETCPHHRLVAELGPDACERAFRRGPVPVTAARRTTPAARPKTQRGPAGDAHRGDSRLERL